MVDLMRWPVVLSSAAQAVEKTSPPAFLTLSPGFRHETLPDEIGLFLPTNVGPKALVEAVAGETGRDGAKLEGTGIGLFLASPFLNVPRAAAQLGRAGIAWIANIPGIQQQDEEFSQQLADVGLDRARELDCLAQFRAKGFRIAVVVADAAGAEAALAVVPDALLVLPRIVDFAAGFPSLRQRGAAASAVASVARGAGWNGLLLGLGDDREAEHEALWPDAVDGLLRRPRPC